MDKLIEAILSKSKRINVYSGHESIDTSEAIALVREAFEGKVLADANKLDSIKDILEVIGNHGESVVNSQDICMKIARDISLMLAASGGEDSNEAV